MANAQDFYKWNPLQGQYSGYTNAIRAAQTMGTAIDNLGVRLGDVGKMMADRYDRIRKEDAEYNTNQALSQIAQIRDQKGLQEALQNGTLDASHWNELYGRDFDYNKLTSAVSNIYDDTLKRADKLDNLRDYTPEGKQRFILAASGIQDNNPVITFTALGDGSKISNKAISNLTSTQLKQSNENVDQGIRRDSVENTRANTEFQQRLSLYGEGSKLEAEATEEQKNIQARLQDVNGLLTNIGSVAVDENGQLKPGEASRIDGYYKTATEKGYAGTPEDFRNDVISGKLGVNHFNIPQPTKQNMLAAFRAAFTPFANGKYSGIVDATGNAIKEAIKNSQPIQVAQSSQSQQTNQPTGNTGTVGGLGTVSSQGIPTSDGNGHLGRSNFNVGEGVKIGGLDRDAFFNLNESPRTQQIPQGSYLAHVMPYVDNLASGNQYNASTKGGVDYNAEFARLNMSTGDAKQLQRSYKDTVVKASARLEEAANAKIQGTIGLNNKGARTLINTLTSSKLPDKLIKEVGANNREQLTYQLQNALNGKNLKQAEELFTKYLNPFLEHSYTSNDLYGLTADVKRRALETARQTGFNPDNLVNILSIIADGSLKGDELKTAVTGLSAMTPSNVAFVKNMVGTLQSNKNYLTSDEFKANVYAYLIQQKDFKGNPLNIFYGESDLIQQRTEASQRGKNLGQQAIKKAASTAGDIQKIRRMLRNHK